MALPSLLSRSGLAVKEEVEQQLQYVTFRIGSEDFGVDILMVQEIIRMPKITPIPNAPPFILGVINLRGKIIPVVDLRIRVALPQTEASDARRIVVVELKEKRIGMLVDSVSQVIRIPAGVVEEMPEEAVNVTENFIKGVGKLDNRLIIILDLNKALLITTGSAN